MTNQTNLSKSLSQGDTLATHTHDDINSQKIVTDVLKVYTATPIHNAPEGTTVLTSISSVYNLWAMIGGTWQNLTGNT